MGNVILCWAPELKFAGVSIERTIDQVLLLAIVCVQCQHYEAQINYYPLSSSKYGFVRLHSGYDSQPSAQTDHSVLAAPFVDADQPVLVISPSDYIREGSSNLTLRCSPPNDPHVNTVFNLEIRRTNNGTTPSMLGSVSVGQAPILGAGLSKQKYTVTGSIISTNATLSYIQLDIINPTKANSGVYSCRYTGSDNLGTTQQQLDKTITVIDPVTLRLSTERGPVEGRVEVYYNGEWVIACISEYDARDAKVVCRQLGYLDPKGIAKPKVLSTSPNSWLMIRGKIWQRFLSCQGTESKLQDCPYSAPYGGFCTGAGYQAGVDCMYLNVRITQEGFVEVFHDHQWKGVCPTDFNIQAGNVVCRQLGFSDGNVIVDISDQDGMNDNPMFEYDFKCKGHETDVSKCMPHKKSSCPVTTAKRIKCLNGSLESLVSMSCSNNGFNIDVDYQALRQLYPQFNESDLLLGGACTGNLTGDRLTFIEVFKDCNSSTKQIDEHTISFINELVYVVNSSATVIDEYRWAIDLECKVISRDGFIEISYKPIESNHQHHVGNSTQFNKHINLYSDPLYQHKVTSAYLNMGLPVYVQIEADKVSGLRMILEDCYAKPDQNSTKAESHILIDNGCEKNDHTHLTRYTDTETRFFFTAYAFPGGEAVVDLHCDVNFCSNLKRSTSCRHGCHVNSAVIG